MTQLKCSFEVGMLEHHEDAWNSKLTYHQASLEKNISAPARYHMISWHIMKWCKIKNTDKHGKFERSHETIGLFFRCVWNLSCCFLVSYGFPGVETLGPTLCDRRSLPSDAEWCHCPFRGEPQKGFGLGKGDAFWWQKSCINIYIYKALYSIYSIYIYIHRYRGI